MSRTLKIEAIEELVNLRNVSARTLDPCTLTIWGNKYCVTTLGAQRGTLRAFFDGNVRLFDLDRLLMWDLDNILLQLDPTFDIKVYQLRRELSNE